MTSPPNHADNDNWDGRAGPWICKVIRLGVTIGAIGAVSPVVVRCRVRHVCSLAQSSVLISVKLCPELSRTKQFH